MKIKTARILRFSFIGKIIFKTRWLDYIARRFFLNKFTEKHYEETTENWETINNILNPILKKYNSFLGHGAALVLLRDGKIKFNQDLDYDIFEMKDYTSFINDMKSKGFELISKCLESNKVIMMIFKYKTAYIDFFVISNHDKHGWSMQTASYEKIRNYFVDNGDGFMKTTKSITYLRKLKKPEIHLYKINNNNIYMSKDYNQYFIDLYGDDWTTPKRYYNWALNPKGNKPKIIKKNIEHFYAKSYINNII